MSYASLSQMPFSRRLAAIITRWQHVILTVCNPYRPELHYMRGPGPKWHAKRQFRSRSGV